MSIESLRHFLLEILPGKILALPSAANRTLQQVPPGLFLCAIALLALGCGWLYRDRLRFSRRERARGAYFQGLAGTPSLQEAVHALTSFFQQIEPDIQRLGVYVRDGASFRLAGAAGEGQAAPDLEKSIQVKEGYQLQGRFHVHTFCPPNARVAVRIVAFNRIETQRIFAELYCISALLENLSKSDGAQSDLVRSRLVDESKSIFNPFLSDRKDYFELVGTILLNAYSLDTLRIISPQGDTVLGAPDFREADGRQLYVRNTDLKFQLFRNSGFTGADVSQIGKFLDLISAVFAMYSSEQHIANYISFLDAAIGVYENNDPFEARHSQKVAAVALAVAAQLGMDSKGRETLGYACRFHDIGMMGQLSGIASKSGNISEKEHARIKYHPAIGRTITKPLDVQYPVSSIIQQHHEFLDGTGYPGGDCAEAISLEAKILAFSEVLIGMMSARPYRPGRSLENAVLELKTLVPHKLDDGVYQAFTQQREAIAAALRELE